MAAGADRAGAGPGTSRPCVLDEPTASLDVRHEMELFELVRQLVDDGLAGLVITHHLNLAARFADRIILLERGELVAEGTPAEVLGRGNPRRRVRVAGGGDQMVATAPLRWYRCATGESCAVSRRGTLLAGTMLMLPATAFAQAPARVVGKVIDAGHWRAARVRRRRVLGDRRATTSSEGAFVLGSVFAGPGGAARAPRRVRSLERCGGCDAGPRPEASRSSWRPCRCNSTA